MTKDELAEVVRLAAETALAKRQTIIADEFDARFHDVKLLMKNYRKLKMHYANISADAEVGVIVSMRHKTGLMMSHVDKMLSTYKALCNESDNSDEVRYWNALYLRYLCDEKLSVDEIAERLHIDKRTFYRDVNKALEDLAVLLFGIEAIGTWKRGK